MVINSFCHLKGFLRCNTASKYTSLIAEKNELAQFLPCKLPTQFFSLQITKMMHPNFEKTGCNSFDEEQDDGLFWSLYSN